MLYAALIINHLCWLLEGVPPRLQLLKEMLFFISNTLFSVLFVAITIVQV